MLREISVYGMMLLSSGLAITTKYAVNKLFCVQTEYYDWKVIHYSYLYNDLSLRLSLSSLTKILYILPHTSIGDCYDVFLLHLDFLSILVIWNCTMFYYYFCQTVKCYESCDLCEYLKHRNLALYNYHSLLTTLRRHTIDIISLCA